MSEKSEVEVGDTIEALWDDGEISARLVGVVSNIDLDGDYETVNGVWINYNGELTPARAPVVNILKKAPVNPAKMFEDAPLASVAVSMVSGSIWQKMHDNSWGRVDENSHRFTRWSDEEMGAKDVLLTPWVAPDDR